MNLKLFAALFFCVAHFSSVAGDVPVTKPAPASPVSQPVFAITADDSANPVATGKLELPQQEPDEIKPTKKNDRPIHIWATRINYDTGLWFFIFLMPFAAGFFLLSSIKSYFKTRDDWRNSTTKENIQLPRTQMGE